MFLLGAIGRGCRDARYLYWPARHLDLVSDALCECTYAAGPWQQLVSTARQRRK